MALRQRLLYLNRYPFQRYAAGQRHLRLTRDVDPTAAPKLIERLGAVSSVSNSMIDLPLPLKRFTVANVGSPRTHLFDVGFQFFQQFVVRRHQSPISSAVISASTCLSRAGRSALEDVGFAFSAPSSDPYVSHATAKEAQPYVSEASSSDAQYACPGEEVGSQTGSTSLKAVHDMDGWITRTVLSIPTVFAHK